MSRRELLKGCIYKGECSVYSFEEGQMVPQTGYMYTCDGTCFITLAMDNVKEKELEEYKPDTLQQYDLFKEGYKYHDSNYDDGLDEADRVDLQKFWKCNVTLI